MDTNWSKSEGRSPKPEKGGSINQAGIAASQRATWLFLLFIRVHWWLNNVALCPGDTRCRNKPIVNWICPATFKALGYRELRTAMSLETAALCKLGKRIPGDVAASRHVRAFAPEATRASN
jgi:hypothetical protein